MLWDGWLTFCLFASSIVLSMASGWRGGLLIIIDSLHMHINICAFFYIYIYIHTFRMKFV